MPAQAVYQPRMRPEELRALLDGAYSTHNQLRSGSLLSRSSVTSCSTLSRDGVPARTAAMVLRDVHDDVDDDVDVEVHVDHVDDVDVDDDVDEEDNDNSGPHHLHQHHPHGSFLHLAQKQSLAAPRGLPLSSSSSSSSSASSGTPPAGLALEHLEAPTTLSLEMQESLLSAVGTHELTIVLGPTGCGKSTLLPQLLAQERRGRRVLLVLPSVLAMCTVANRIRDTQHPSAPTQPSRQQQTSHGNESACHPDTPEAAVSMEMWLPDDVCSTPSVAPFQQSPVSSSSSSSPVPQLVLTTPAVLLRRMLSSAHTIIQNYILIMDECHEPSIERDLVLSLIRERWNYDRNREHYRNYPTIRKSRVPRDQSCRLILLSATPAVDRYRDYFNNVLSMPPAVMNLDTERYFQRRDRHDRIKTFYLSDLRDSLPTTQRQNLSDFVRQMRINPDADLQYRDGQELSPSMLTLLVELIRQRHQEEPMFGSIMVFLPDIWHIDQLTRALTAALPSTFLINSNYDTASTATTTATAMDNVVSDDDSNYGNNHGGHLQLELTTLTPGMHFEDCLLALRQQSTKSKRKLFVATTTDCFVESCVTIPNLSCVIDLCRSTEEHLADGGQHIDSNNNNNNNNNNNSTNNSINSRHGNKFKTTPRVTKTVWSSQSECDQRSGRTGRTCKGSVYRMIDRGFYLSRFPKQPAPLLPRSDCHEQLFMLSNNTNTSDNKEKSKRIYNRATYNKSNRVNGIPNRNWTKSAATGSTIATPPPPSPPASLSFWKKIVPAAVLRMAMDPPSVQTLEDARTFLHQTRICNSIGDQKALQATTYGQILHAIPLDMNHARIALRGARFGLLHEALAICAIQKHGSTIVMDPTNPNHFRSELDRRYSAPSSDSRTIAHLAAYMHWDAAWRHSAQRQQALHEEFYRISTDQTQYTNHSGQDGYGTNTNTKPISNVYGWTPEMEADNAAWCAEHGIHPLKVRAVAETIDQTVHILFSTKFEPDWLRCSDPLPTWIRRRDWNGTGTDDTDVLTQIYGQEATLLCDTLTALLDEDEMIQVPIGLNGHNVACIHYLQNKCKFGKSCRFSHLPSAVRPPCRFFRLGLCTKGEDCLYSHESSMNFASDADDDPLSAQVPTKRSLFIHGGAPTWFERHHHRLLMLGEGSFAFTKALEWRGFAPYMSSTDACEVAMDGNMRNIYHSQILCGVDATRLHMDGRIVMEASMRNITSFAWNFPSAHRDRYRPNRDNRRNGGSAGRNGNGNGNALDNDGDDDDDNNDEEAWERQHSQDSERLLQEAFQSIALLKSMVPQHSGVWWSFAVVLHADQFSKWKVLSKASQAGWQLSKWGAFHPAVFDGYKPTEHTGERMSPDSARMYLFCLPGDEEEDWEAQRADQSLRLSALDGFG